MTIERANYSSPATGQDSHVEMPTSICLRVTSREPTGQNGVLARTDREDQWEWSISEDDLQRVALTIHELVCGPEHEYDRLCVSAESEAGIEVRVTDLADW